MEDKKNIIVIHHNDADGRCAAAIVNQKFQGQPIDFIEMDYAKVLPLGEIGKDEMVFIVDFSLKPEVMVKLLEITPNVIWCDHHATAKAYDYGREMAGFRDFSDKGLCGAECTWRYLNGINVFPWGLNLLGDYDSWRMKLKPSCLEFYEGLKLRPQHPSSETWIKLLSDSTDWVHEVMAQGRAVIEYRDIYCEEMNKAFGFATEFEGLKIWVTNIYRFGSQAYGDRMQQYDACVACAFDGIKWTVSLYSEKPNVDVSLICKKYGGGGHKGAAGFTCNKLPFKK